MRHAELASCRELQASRRAASLTRKARVWKFKGQVLWQRNHHMQLIPCPTWLVMVVMLKKCLWQLRSQPLLKLQHTRAICPKRKRSSLREGRPGRKILLVFSQLNYRKPKPPYHFNLIPPRHLSSLLKNQHLPNNLFRLQGRQCKFRNLWGSGEGR